MKKSILIIFTLGIIISCRKNASVADMISDNYTGTFTRTTGTVDSTAYIKMNFNAGRFSGSSDKDYPGICEGSYGITADSISFGNDCEVPEDYKYSTRLFGKYQLNRQGDSLVFSRSFGDFQYEADFYRLKKQ
jgi:hypothetical protein